MYHLERNSMTPDEIQALREKHKPHFVNGVRDICYWCSADPYTQGIPAIYPCDVIKVLDAWETERTRKNHWSLNTLCYTCQVPYPCSIISNDE